MVGSVHVSAQDPDKQIFDAPESFHPPKAWASSAHVSGLEAYERMYKLSIDQPDEFWSGIAEADYHWNRKWSAPFCRYDMAEVKFGMHQHRDREPCPQLEF